MKLQPDDSEDKYIVFALIFMLSNQLQTIGDSFFEEISTKQWFVLLVLGGIMKGEATTLNELSEAVGSSHQNVKQLVLKLEQKGFVETYKDPEDARRLRIRITPKSIEFNESYQQKSSTFLNTLFEGFKEKDLSNMKQIMLKMREKLEGMGKDYV